MFKLICSFSRRLLAGKNKPALTVYLCEAELYRNKHYLYDITSNIAAASAEEALAIFKQNQKYCNATVSNPRAIPIFPSAC